MNRNSDTELMQIATGSTIDVWKNYAPFDGYGGVNCQVVVSDYNGDAIDDRAVKCGKTWKIAYTLPETTDFRIVTLEDDIEMSLPSFVYAGGVKYEDIKAIYNTYKEDIDCEDPHSCSILDAKPPISPYFAECVKNWAVPPFYCWR